MWTICPGFQHLGRLGLVNVDSHNSLTRYLALKETLLQSIGSVTVYIYCPKAVMSQNEGLALTLQWWDWNQEGFFLHMDSPGRVRRDSRFKTSHVCSIFFGLFIFYFFEDNIKKQKQPDRLVYNKGAAAVTVCVSTCLAKGRETLAGAHSAAEDNKGHLKGSELHLGQTRQEERWSTLPAAKCSG